jgi:Rrf2 family protein
MRLEVTRRSDLATRALVALAAAERRPGGSRLKSAALAASVGTTAGFVPQVLGPLVAAGWVRSDPGPTGGYSLAARLEDITLLQVIEAVEGTTDAGRCVLADRPCTPAEPCALHEPWTRARGQLLGELAATTIADIADQLPAVTVRTPRPGPAPAR